ncbi:hypothetical protein BDN67DRAFT_986112, partial [Paxillus ammoniavirescens]
MDLKLSELECLLHYVSVHLMTIHEQSTRPEKGPLDPIPELYASFGLEELRVARRAVTLMAVWGLSHGLPGPLRTLGPQFIAAKMDGQVGMIAVMKGMMADNCEDLIEDKRSGLPWQDAWWQLGFSNAHRAKREEEGKRVHNAGDEPEANPGGERGDLRRIWAYACSGGVWARLYSLGMPETVTQMVVYVILTQPVEGGRGKREKERKRERRKERERTGTLLTGRADIWAMQTRNGRVREPVKQEGGAPGKLGCGHGECWFPTALITALPELSCRLSAGPDTSAAPQADEDRGPTTYNAHCHAFFNRELHLNHSLDRALEVPPELPLRLTDLIADYMLDRLNDYLQSDPNVTPSIPSPYIPVDAVQQADRFTEMLALAYKNPSEYPIGYAVVVVLTSLVVIDINAKHLQEGLNAHDYGMNEKWEVDLLHCFNILEIPPIVTLAVLVDKAGV